jgi:hypothetical protein
MNKDNIYQTSLMCELKMNEINSSEKFATMIYEDLFALLTLREDKSLFSCDCSCNKNKFIIIITEESEENIDDNICKYMFEYSVETGFYPFDYVKNLYSKFLDKNYIYIYILAINRDCVN